MKTKVTMTEYMIGNLTYFRVHWWTRRGYSSASTWDRAAAVALRDRLMRRIVIFGLSLAIIITLCIILNALDDYAHQVHYVDVVPAGNEMHVPFMEERPQPYRGRSFLTA